MALIKRKPTSIYSIARELGVNPGTPPALPPALEVDIIVRESCRMGFGRNVFAALGITILIRRI